MAAARLSVLRALWNPTKIIPSKTVRDIREIDFGALKKAGYNAIVFDKDNCLTLPLQDRLVPELQSTFENVKTVFGPARVLIVSNSSGTPSEDPGYLEVEALERQFGVPVLRHRSKKPSRKCAQEIKTYFHDHPPSFTHSTLTAPTTPNLAILSTDTTGYTILPNPDEVIRPTATPINSSTGTTLSPTASNTSKRAPSRVDSSQDIQKFDDTSSKFTPRTIPIIPGGVVNSDSASPIISATQSAESSISGPDSPVSGSNLTASQTIAMVTTKNGTAAALNLQTEPQPRPQPNQDLKLVIIGDRLMTDVLLANDMGAYSIWTTRIWEREALLLRLIERTYLLSVRSALFFANRVVPTTIQSLRFIGYRVVPVTWGYLSSFMIVVWHYTQKSLQWTWRQLGQSRSTGSRNTDQHQQKKFETTQTPQNAQNIRIDQN